MLIRRAILGMALALSSLTAHAADTVTPRDVQNNPIGYTVPFCPVGATGLFAACSTANPLPVAVVSGGGGGGGGGATGSVGAAGTNGTTAQSVQGINGGVPVPVSGTFWQPTQPVSVVSLPLPAGASTSAAQATGNSSLSSIDTKTPPLNNGRVPVDTGNAAATQTTTGALQPPTAASGKIARTSTALAASTSTTIAAANANRIALGIQCGSGAVSVDETGGALTAAAVGNGTLFIPAGTAPYFTPPIATLTAVTAYTATAQSCVVTEYLR